MGTEWLIAAAIGLLLPVGIHRRLLATVRKRFRKRGLHRVNYQGVEVVTAGGVMLVISTAAALLGMLMVIGIGSKESSVWKEGALMGAGMLAIAFWGWQDDCAVDKQAKGFRGHFGTLWRERRMTSGLWKVWGAGSTAIVLALALGPENLWSGLLTACLLASATNVLNLFDLRPARAIKVFWLLEAVAISLCYWTSDLPSFFKHGIWQLPMLAATCMLFRHDAGARVMLGDTGSNTLGFVVGFAFAAGTPLIVQLMIFLLFVGVHIVAEFFSISKLIESSRWLTRIDRWGRSAEP
ncbi:UDP-N-acetylmuramyl pentapeptide phosphotransferase [Brevibacillus nitrificans]|uniref:UDP-N-acetylmuramyl pentapeptide phosphotransferase n=1 Tax=Brevibacillus nitrificans TaxID=651560 RepID=UPI002E21A27F|nr:UDP-N-acetylmuramyl pentapeptide phosphotransferase [Brevibacillus nitrificans]